MPENRKGYPERQAAETVRGRGNTVRLIMGRDLLGDRILRHLAGNRGTVSMGKIGFNRFVPFSSGLQGGTLGLSPSGGDPADRLSAGKGGAQWFQRKRGFPPSKRSRPGQSPGRFFFSLACLGAILSEMDESQDDHGSDARMLRLSFSAYACLRGHDPRAGRTAVSQALRFFGVPGKVDWFGLSDDHHQFNFALAFVVADEADGVTDYAVVVRGTNPLSLDSWFREDFDVGTLVPWSHDPGAGRISQATATALSLHEGLKDRKLSLFAYLAQRLLADEAAGRRSAVRFTGHSLGGLLAPTLALRFTESIHRLPLVVFHLASFAAPTAGDSAFAAHLERSILGDLRQEFGTVRFIRCRDDVAVKVWNKRDLLGIVRLYAAYGVPINLFLLTIVAAVRWRVRRLDYTQPFSGEPEGGRFRVAANRVFGTEGLDAEAFLPETLQAQFHRARAVAKRRTSPRIFRNTLAWLVQAVVMHVVPYAVHFLEPREQTYVRDTLLRTILNQDVLFTERRQTNDHDASQGISGTGSPR